MKGEPANTHHKREVVAAWAVHAFTASGAVLGFLALVAILEGDKIAAFMWLGLALFVDAIDGTIARRIGVTEITPRFDGATLDNVIDYFTYVVVPALMVYWFGVVPPGWEVPAAATIMAVSCYTFANLDMKTSDYYFSGFPALWNVVVLYLHVLQLNPWTNLVVIGICAVLTFIPIKFVHPLRVRKLRNITVPVTFLWAATSLRLVLIHPDVTKAKEASPLVFWMWVAASVYFAIICIWRSIHPEPEEDGPEAASSL
ncbi:MAG: CDP-alcohol phosphatidyltransferase family protein [Hyphomicrobiales bacterium]